MNFSPIRDYVYRVFKVCIQAFLLFCTTVLVNTGLLWAIRIFKLTYFETMPIRLLHKTYFPGNIAPKDGTAACDMENLATLWPIRAEGTKKSGSSPKSLPDFQSVFPNEDACYAYLCKARFPDGFVCPYCGLTGNPYRFQTRPDMLRCQGCERDTRLTAGTIMQKSKLPLCKGGRWFQNVLNRLLYFW